MFNYNEPVSRVYSSIKLPLNENGMWLVQSTVNNALTIVPYINLILFINCEKHNNLILLFILGTVPALEYEEGKAIFDSSIINYYLDEKYPEVPLQSTDPLRRAEDKIIVELFAAVSILITYYFNVKLN